MLFMDFQFTVLQLTIKFRAIQFVNEYVMRCSVHVINITLHM